MPEVKIKKRFIKTSPRKIRAIIDLIRGLGINQAKDQLDFCKRSAAKDVLEALNSAVAAAKDKSFDLDNTWIKEIYCNEGPRLKRRFFRAKGRATIVNKRMSCLEIYLQEKNITKTKKGVR